MEEKTYGRHLRRDVADLRREYMQRELDESDIAADPITQFASWYREALTSGVVEPNAMTLATVAAEGRPSARIVLLKDFDAHGFTFFTNYDSRKGRELEQNPWAALVFWWDVMERQVRIEGRVARVAPEMSDEYFASRPYGSRLGAWASPQSRVLPDRGALTEALTALDAKYSGGDVPRPPHWGGYRLSPTAVEFWQGRPSRLHDRIRYTLQPDGTWRTERLAP
ncbi:MAG TPA: pyridoxamine 5'-phosphate oxidase [Rhodothermales bacterium]|nr:pyridoxamine 5'-phosphate oxidase [Rhodothermales bacterium]